jgi:dTDP-4-amino-4,6-dideoxygalactose transaminase
MSPASLEEYLVRCAKDPKSGRPLGARTGRPIKAIVPVHLYGQVADMDALMNIAARYGLLVIEDACQAHGARYQSTDGTWRRAGTFGSAAAFSFYPGKNLGACGEAGAVTTNDASIAATIRMLREHGQAKKYYHDLEGYNGRLDAIQAGFLRVKLRHLDDWNAQRRAAAARYTAALVSTPEVTLPFESERCHSVYHLYVIRSSNRDDLAGFMKDQGVSTGLHYPLPLHLQNCYKGRGYLPGALPNTERAAAEILSLPMFPGLSSADQQRVAAVIAQGVAALSVAKSIQ